MGEPIAVVSVKPASSDEVVFETNRNFTGMGHESYSSVEDTSQGRLVDDMARMLLEDGNAKAVHIYAQAVSVVPGDGFDAEKVKGLIESFYIYYKPGVEVPDESSFS